MVKMSFLKWFIFGLFISMIESKIDSKSDLKSGRREGKSIGFLFYFFKMPKFYLLKKIITFLLHDVEKTRAKSQVFSYIRVKK